MTPRIEGVFGRPANDERRSRSGHAQLTFATGYLDVDRSVHTARRGETLCVAVGDPRVDAHARLRDATDGNPAESWIDLFERFGVDAPAQVRGRFAVVLADPAQRRIFLAVDRFATWPLCFALHEGAVAFSDRADCVPGDTRRISRQALFDYFYFHVIPAPRTVFEDVERLPAGHVLTCDDGRVTQHRYWNPRFVDEYRDLDAAKDEFRRLVREAVEREAASHSAGAFLSGGTDSSTVAGMLTKVGEGRAKTYSIGFDVGGYDEMAYARIASAHFGTEHHEYYVKPADIVEGLPRIAGAYDQPFGNSSVLPAWVCARMARDDGIDKMLAGDGGDELFGGNVRYAKQRIFGFYDSVPAPVRRHLVEPMLRLRGIGSIPLARKGRSYIDQARVAMPERTEMYNLLSRLGPDNVFTREFLASVDGGAPLRAQQESWNAIQASTLIDRMLAFDWKYTLADNDLPKVIGATSLADVAVGFPLLADEIVEFSLRLRPEWKLKGLTLRWFFKEALKDFLPAEIIAKKKHGFGLPFGRWVVSDDALARLVQRSLDGFAARNIARPEFLRELMQHRMREHPGYYGELVWLITVAEHWFEVHDADWRLDG